MTEAAVQQDVDGTSQSDETTTQYEQEALKYGWVPESEFTGTGSHMGAEAFMERGPGTSRKALAENVELKKQLEGARSSFDARFKRLENTFAAAAEANQEALRSEYERNKQAAFDDGDIDKLKTLTDEHEKGITQPAAPVAQEIPEAERQVIEAWASKNGWFQVHKKATDDALGYYEALTGQGKPPKEALETLSGYIAGDYPHLKAVGFETPKPESTRTAAAVEGGGLGATKTTKKGWKDVPAEDRALVKNQLSDGLWDKLAEKMKTTPQEAWASKYHEQD